VPNNIGFAYGPAAISSVYALMKLMLGVRLVKSSPGTAIVTRWEQPPMV
jgi:hypothetical protein